MRDRVSEREKLYITEHYYDIVTGELDKQIETLELYDRTYPTDSVPGNNLAIAYSQIGEFEKAAEAARRSIVADPNSNNAYSTLSYAYFAMGKTDESRQTIDQALKLFQIQKIFTGLPCGSHWHSINRMRPNATLPGPRASPANTPFSTFRRVPCKAKASCGCRAN